MMTDNNNNNNDATEYHLAIEILKVILPTVILI